MFNKQATTDTQHTQDANNFRNGCGKHFGRKFGNRSGDAFGGKAPWMQAFAGGPGSRKAANIEETDSAFIISLYAAGLTKKDFNISATDDVLTISHTAPKAAEDSQTKYTHVEYQPASFERSFQLNGKVLTANISATYTDGVLKVALPKDPDTNKPAQEIKVG